MNKFSNILKLISSRNSMGTAILKHRYGMYTSQISALSNFINRQCHSYGLASTKNDSFYTAISRLDFNDIDILINFINNTERPTHVVLASQIKLTDAYKYKVNRSKFIYFINEVIKLGKCQLTILSNRVNVHDINFTDCSLFFMIKKQFCDDNRDRKLFTINGAPRLLWITEINQNIDITCQSVDTFGTDQIYLSKNILKINTNYLNLSKLWLETYGEFCQLNQMLKSFKYCSWKSYTDSTFTGIKFNNAIPMQRVVMKAKRILDNGNMS